MRTGKKLYWSPGKVDYNETGRKDHLVEIEWELIDGKFSMSGSIWNPRRTDIVQGGQCLDTILEYFPDNPQVQSMHRIWKDWHLNDMNAGSPAQQAFLKENPCPEGQNHYDYAKAALAKAGLDPDPNYLVIKEFDKPVDPSKPDGPKNKVKAQVPYSYGSQWLKAELPEEVIEEIKSWKDHKYLEPFPDNFSVFLEKNFVHEIKYLGEQTENKWTYDRYELVIAPRHPSGHTDLKKDSVRFDYRQGLGHRKTQTGAKWSEKDGRGNGNWYIKHQFSPTKSAPSLKTILGCVISDVRTVEEYPDFVDLAEEFGYAPKEARRVWVSCDIAREKLKKVAGRHYHKLMDENYTGEEDAKTEVQNR